MTIAADQSYTLLYSMVSFEPHTGFLKNLRLKYPEIEIPYLDLEHLPEAAREPFDSYLYLPAGPSSPKLLGQINRETGGGRSFPVRFEAMGVLPGRNVLEMLQQLTGEFEVSAESGKWFRVKTGPHRNLTVKMVDRDDERGLATVRFNVLDQDREVTLEQGNLEPAEQPTDPYASFQNLLTTAREKGAVIIDGDAELPEACRRCPNIYARPDPEEVARAIAAGIDPPAYGKHVGGAYGFYFSILRFRRIYPERELHLVFDGRPEAGLGGFECANWTEEQREVYQRNRDWVKRFALACGAYVYEIPGARQEDTIASLATTLTERFGYSRVLVYTKGDTLFPLVSEKVDLILPKYNYRDHPQTIRVPEALRKFGLLAEGQEADPALVERIIWVKAISGDVSEIPSVNLHNKLVHHPCTQIRMTDYLPHILAASSVTDLKLRLLSHEAFQPFVSSGQFDSNLEAVRLKRNLLDGYNTLSGFRIETPEGDGFVDPVAIRALLKENSFEKEIEYVESNVRVIAGIYSRGSALFLS